MKQAQSPQTSGDDNTLMPDTLRKLETFAEGVQVGARMMFSTFVFGLLLVCAPRNWERAERLVQRGWLLPEKISIVAFGAAGAFLSIASRESNDPFVESDTSRQLGAALSALEPSPKSPASALLVLFAIYQIFGFTILVGKRLVKLAVPSSQGRDAGTLLSTVLVSSTVYCLIGQFVVQAQRPMNTTLQTASVLFVIASCMLLVLCAGWNFSSSGGAGTSIRERLMSACAFLATPVIALITMLFLSALTMHFEVFLRYEDTVKVEPAECTRSDIYIDCMFLVVAGPHRVMLDPPRSITVRWKDGLQRDASALSSVQIAPVGESGTVKLAPGKPAVFLARFAARQACQLLASPLPFPLAPRPAHDFEVELNWPASFYVHRQTGRMAVHQSFTSTFSWVTLVYNNCRPTSRAEAPLRGK